jgi:hypothetical protein
VLLTQAMHVQNEFKKVITINDIVNDQNHLMLNKVLHATRAMDTGMRTFLELCNAMPISNYSLGAYLKELKKGKSNHFRRLNQGIAERIQRGVVDKRNTYLHAAGKFPSKQEAEKLADDTLDYLQTILNLAEF